MVSYADTGFLVSLYLEEKTTAVAEEILKSIPLPIIITPLSLLELRNALNFSVFRGRITTEKRDEILLDATVQSASGFYQLADVSQSKIYVKAGELSDKYTLLFGTRSLDLLHVAAAALIKAQVFLSFDERQRRAASGEGIKVKP